MSQFFQFTYRIPLLVDPIWLHLFTIQKITAVEQKHWTGSVRKFVLFLRQTNLPIAEKRHLLPLQLFSDVNSILYGITFISKFVTAAEIQWQTTLQRGNSTPTTQPKFTQGSFKPIRKATRTSRGTFCAWRMCEHLINLLGVRCGGNLTRMQTIEASSL